MVAILYVVPVQPGDGIAPDTQVPRLLDYAGSRRLECPDFPGFPVPPQQQNGRYLVAGLLGRILLGVVAVCGDGVPGLHAVVLRLPPCGPHHIPAFQDDIGLALHMPVVGVSEVDAGVLDDLRSDAALCVLAGFHVRVPPGVGAAVPIHRRVSGVLPHQGGHPVSLGEGFQLFVDDPGRFQQPLCVGGCRQGRCLDFDVVGGNGGDGKAAHPLQDVENRGGQPVRHNALPLFADKEVLVHPNRLVQVDGGVVGKRPFVELPHAFAGKRPAKVSLAEGVQAGGVRSLLNLLRHLLPPFSLRRSRSS